MNALYSTFEADGVDFALTVTFKGANAPTTLVGGTISVSAINTVTKTKYTGQGTILSATAVYCATTPGALPPGIYIVQVRVKPVGYKERTIYSATFVVNQSA